MEYRENTPVKRKKTLVTAACSLAALFVIGFVSVWFLSQPKIDSLISLDVNPGIEISTDRDDRVLDCRALNEDGQRVLSDMDLQGVTLNVASNALIGSMVTQGYLSTDDAANTILVSVMNDDAEKAAQVQQEFSKDIDAVLKQQGVQATVLQQSASSSDDLESYAKQYGISIGKADFIRKLVEKDSTLDPAELANMPIRELSALISERGIDVSDIVTEYDGNLNHQIKDTIDDVNEQNGVGDDQYCEYCGQLHSVCQNNCDKSGGERYCDDCGRLNADCQDRCKYNGDGNGNGNGAGNGNGPGDGTGYGAGNGNGPGDGTGYGAGNGNGPGDGTGYGAGNGNGNGSGNGNGYGAGNGNGNGAKHQHGWNDDDWDDDDWDDDDWDDDEYCEYCGQIRGSCRGSCGRSGEKLYCDECGRLNSICKDSCD